MARKESWFSRDYSIQDSIGSKIASCHESWFSRSCNVNCSDITIDLKPGTKYLAKSNGVVIAETTFSSVLKNSGIITWQDRSVTFEPHKPSSWKSFLIGSVCFNYCLKEKGSTVGSVIMPNIRTISAGKKQWDRIISAPDDWPIYVIILLFCVCGYHQDVAV